MILSGQLQCITAHIVAGAEVGVPGLARSAAGTKLHAQAQRLHTPGTEGLQPMPRFLKGSGMHRAEQPHQQHRAPQFLKGGKPLRHSRQAPAIQDQEVSEEDDACEDDMVAEVAEERPRRRRKRIRRHEDGYNEAAQVKALECYILSAGLLLTSACHMCARHLNYLTLPENAQSRLQRCLKGGS